MISVYPKAADTMRMSPRPPKSVSRNADAPDLYEQNEALHQRIELLQRKLREREYDFRVRNALYQIGELTWSCGDMDALYHSIHEVVRGLMYAENFYIATYDELSDQIEVCYCVDIKDGPDPLKHILENPESGKTLTRYLLQTKVALLATADRLLQLRTEQKFQLQETLAQSWLGVPLSYHDQVLGAVVVQSYNPGQLYSQRDQALLIFVSQQIALAIVRKRQEQSILQAQQVLEETVERRTIELRNNNRALEMEIQAREKGESLQNTLYQIANLSDSRIDIESFFEVVHTLISHLIYAHNFYIGLLDDQQQLYFPYIVDHWADVYGNCAYQPKGAHWELMKRVLANKQPLLVTQSQADINNPCSNEPASATSWLGVPMVYEQALFGVLAVQSYRQEVSYQEADKNLLLFVAQHIAKVLQRRKLSVKDN